MTSLRKFLLVAVACAMAATIACAINPQPLPPGAANDPAPNQGPDAAGKDESVSDPNFGSDGGSGVFPHADAGAFSDASSPPDNTGDASLDGSLDADGAPIDTGSGDASFDSAVDSD
jgi:hypothetical protein